MFILKSGVFRRSIDLPVIHWNQGFSIFVSFNNNLFSRWIQNIVLEHKYQIKYHRRESQEKLSNIE